MAEDDRDLGRIAPRQTLVLVHRELLGVYGDAALGAAERDVDDGALPGHPHRERLDLVERDAGMEADAALRGAPRDRVLDAVPGEDLDLLVVHLDRYGHGQLALRQAQELARSGVEREEVRGAFELDERKLVGVEVLGGRGCRGNGRLGPGGGLRGLALRCHASLSPSPRGVSVVSVDPDQGPEKGRVAAARRASSQRDDGKIPRARMPAAHSARARRSAGARGGGPSSSTGSRM